MWRFTLGESGARRVINCDPNDEIVHGKAAAARKQEAESKKGADFRQRLLMEALD